MFTRRSFLTTTGAALASGCGLANALNPSPPPQAAAPPTDPQAREPATDSKGGLQITDRINGVDRYATLVVPRSYDADKGAPVVLCAHGSGGEPESMADRFGWRRACEDNGWIGVFPKLGVDAMAGLDESFLITLLDRVDGEYAVDSSRVFGVGFSGGCRKMYRLAAARSSRLTAIAVSSGVVTYADETTQDPAMHDADVLSIAHVHGAQDPKVPLNGGDHETRDGTVRRIVPARDALQRWIDHFDLQEATDDRRPDTLPERVSLERWRARSGHALWLMVDPQLKHRWPERWATTVLSSFLAASPARR